MESGREYLNRKVYRNVFRECGFSDAQIRKRVADTFEELFYGPEAIYHRCGDTMGYIEDTGNEDVRTEGMSYGMMMCVQMDRKKEFDALWKWVKTYMYLKQGRCAGCFAWSVHTDGTKNADGPAPDGEEYFAMALFFAAHRWGDGTGIFQYSKEAVQLLSICRPLMWNQKNNLIRFVPGMEMTDPSYHLPHFYELFSLWADPADRKFWSKAAKASRMYLKKACNPQTGLSPEYSDYEGVPYCDKQEIFGRHDWFYSDAYRTIANIAMDYEWFLKGTKEGAWNMQTAEQIQTFFAKVAGEKMDGVYSVTGELLEQKAMHPLAVRATCAQASLASNGKYAQKFVREFWNTPLRQGKRRYYDNCLYMFAMLALSGNYRIW